MSRAFVKENDEAVGALPDRRVSAHPNLVTAEGFAAIEAELARLQQAYVRASDNPATLAAISRELRYWTSRRAAAQVMPAPRAPTKVQFGCAVTFARMDGQRKTYRIVGEDEADPTRGTISYVSPVARALMGSQLGDVVEVGTSQVEVVSIA